MKKTFILFFYISILLCGCQVAPAIEPVISKNDGSFDANAALSASESHEPDATQAVSYDDLFESTDGTVQFRFNISEMVTDADMPIVKVTPHMLTGEDVKRVTESLFGVGPFYELDSFVDPVLSKERIQENISLWSQYSNEESLKDLYGESPFNLDLVQKFISEYSQQYESAPTEVEHEQTQWQFQNGSRYWLSSQDRATMGSSGFNDEIVLDIQDNGVHYLLIASTRDKQTSKLNSISVDLYGGTSPDDINTRIYYAQLCRTEKPTADQIENAKQIAMSMLSKMDLGEWVIDQCFVSSSFYQNENEYMINVNAVPAFNGVACVRQDQFASLSSDETSYAFNYYLTDIHFAFSSEGKLVEFSLESPVDMQEVVNDNVASLDINTLLERAKEHLKLSDYYQYGFGSVIDDIKKKEDLECIVTVDQLEYNLLRVKVPDSYDSYYYVPGLVLSGTTEYYGKDSGNLYYTYSDPSKENKNSRTLLVLNAVDGTVVRS